MKKLLLTTAALAALVSANPAEAARRGGSAEGLLFVAAIDEVDSTGAPLSLCILEKTRTVLFIPLFRSAQEYVLATNQCATDSYYSIDPAKFAAAQAAGYLPANLPAEPELSTSQLISGMWGWALALPLAIFGFMKRGGGSRPKLDSFADRVVAVMCAVARADGQVDDAEIYVMGDVLRQLTGRDYDLNQVAAYARSLSGDLSDRDLKKLGKGLNPAQCEALVQAAVMIADSDGNVEGAENHLIVRLSRALKVGGDRVDAMLNPSTPAAVPAE